MYVRHGHINNCGHLFATFSSRDRDMASLVPGSNNVANLVNFLSGSRRSRFASTIRFNSRMIGDLRGTHSLAECLYFMTDQCDVTNVNKAATNHVCEAEKWFFLFLLLTQQQI